MLVKNLKAIRFSQGVGLGLRVLALLSALAGLSIVLFGLVYLLPAFAAVIAALAAAEAVLFARALTAYGRKRRGLLREMEEFIFGRRLLYLDSLAEFEQKGAEAELVRQAGLELKSGGMLDRYNRGFRIKWLLESAALLVFVFSCAAAAWAFSAGSLKKLAGIGEFFSAGARSVLPEFYVLSKPLAIDLGADAGRFDRLYLVVSNEALSSSNAVFVLDEPYTSRESLSVSVVAEKFGVSRTLAGGTLVATTRLLPNHITLRVVYPPETGLRQEEYAVLQDLEVWSGATVIIEGDMTINLVSAVLSPSGGSSSSVSGNGFRIGYFADATRRLAIELVSADGDRFVTPGFMVKVSPNNPPGLKLLFPTGPVMVNAYRWSVSSILEAEDDQGVAKIRVDVTVSNRDLALSRFTVKNSWDVPCGGEKYLKKVLKFTYESMELLPDDVASVRFRAVDVFGLVSPEAGFDIISPDLADIQEERRDIQTNISHTLDRLSNSFEGLKKDLKDRNLTGYDQKSKDIDSGVSNLRDSIDRLKSDTVYSESISDIRQTLEEMKRITESLRKNSDIIKEVSKMLQDRNSSTERVDLDKMGAKDMLKELSSLLKNLDYYKKYADTVSQFRIVQDAYGQLKKQKDGAQFRKNLDAYRKELDKLSSMGGDRVRDLDAKLSEESGRLDKDDPKSFDNSDRLMQELSGEIRKQLDNAAADRLREKRDRLQKAVEEVFLCVSVLQETMGLDLGNSAAPSVSNVNAVVENVNSVHAGLKAVEVEVRGVLEGLVFGGGGTNIQDDIGACLANNQKLVESIQGSLRDYSLNAASEALSLLNNNAAVLALLLLKVNNGLQNAMDQGGKGQNQTLSLGMGDLMRMQSSVSSGLEDLMKRMEKEGGLTPEMKEMMDQLSKLQDEIRKNLREMMGGDKDGVLSGGNDMSRNMEDIIKDLQSYNVSTDTIDKSKKLEEKMLESKKSIQSKGVSEDRQSETAKIYEVTSPDLNKTDERGKFDLGSLTNRYIPEYYKRLIEKYARQTPTN